MFVANAKVWSIRVNTAPPCPRDMLFMCSSLSSIVQMTLSLGSMILYEATLSYLNLGVKAPYAAWGTMINIISTNQDILQNHLNVWVPAGICIVIAVLGFNFVGDGLRDALDPKARR